MSEKKINKEFLREHIADMKFLMEHTMMGWSSDLFGDMKKYSELASVFYSYLLREKISQEEADAFGKEKNTLLQSLFEKEHNDSDGSLFDILETELKLERTKYNRTIKSELEYEYETSPQGIALAETINKNSNIVSSEEFFKDE